MEQTQQNVTEYHEELLQGSQPHYAGFWIRVGAYLVDAIVLWVVFGILRALFGFDGGHPKMAIGFGGAGLIISWLYFAFFESSKYQGTFGKQAFSLQVTDMAGNRISFARATARYFSKILSGLILYIGYIMVAFTEKNQGLHDKIVKTYVIKKKD